MDPINSNPFFNSARFYQNQPAQQKPTPSVDPAAAAESQSIKPTPAADSEYTNLFDDDALLKLQSNLEAIAQMAEQSLKRIDS
ncbi:hypothetical protein [Pelagicoccus sp. SDUM812005]|uniref:hypothetical protein n=1 Tax=Pelagicoccus sp. SDUM812005 TaxID=3041257 RepID=UPI00280CC6A3|nr:hypothetical protein [Pelagicoccus sp. SDUM812005]MDQ8179727.1 hypothetical protein [Pelagicoccus sp. SDUM812005]